MIKAISIICIILLLGIIFVVIESVIECSKTRVTKYTIKSSNINESIKLVMMADLHNCNHKDNNKNMLNIIKNEKPDAIILAGDMIVSHSDQDEENIQTALFIEKLADIASVYYGIGNHEKRAIISEYKLNILWKEYISYFKDKNVFLLENDKKKITLNNSNVTISGLDLDIDYYKRFIEKKLTKQDIVSMIGEVDSDSYNILIAHNPDYFEVYADYGAELVCSGHNHGGLMRLPFLGGVISPRLRIFPKYDYGIYTKNNTKMVLTGGLGAHSIKIRVNNVPEIVVLNIVKE